MVKAKPKKSLHPRHYVREWRKYRGLTQERLAERIEATHGAISQLEHGHINYTQPMLEALAVALDCTPAQLLMPPPTDVENEFAAFVMRMDAERRLRALQILKITLGDERVA